MISKVLDLLEFSSRRSVPLLLQTEVSECGLSCLAMISSYHGNKNDISSIRKMNVVGMGGVNLQQMIMFADNLDLSSRALKCPLKDIGKLNLPCILHWDMKHFVVLTSVSHNGVIINDPALGKRKLTLSELGDHYTGIALELTPTINFKRVDQRERMHLTQLWSKITGLKSGLVSLLSLSIILQIIALVNPYYIQVVVDEVLVSRDQPLMLVLAVGFGLLVVINAISTAVRSYLILRLSSMMNMQMSVNLLHHLLRLPMSYFEKRHIGDLVSRFGSLSNIRERLTTGITETLIDGLMSITVLVMMSIYSFELTVIVLVTVVSYVLIRAALFPSLKSNTEELITTGAKEQSNFLESIRGIQTIKLHTSESTRQSLWLNRYAEVVNSEIRLGKLNISFKASNGVLFGMENVFVIYTAAMLVMDGVLTVGMLLAFIAYKNQFTKHVTNFIEQVIEFRMLRLHLERISDIALSDKESNRQSQLNLDEVKGVIELENVSFRYSESSPWILNDCNISIKDGEALAIVGKSGCGKSTLIKIMLGLLDPTEGKVLLDGVDIKHIGLTQYRSYLSAVMQNDTLLSGSVLDNITFFSQNPNISKVKRCAEIVAIDSDVNKMIMGYNSLVGDMGSQFSGGQVQRLLLARALYKEPKVLFMDEATSNLDVENEVNISNEIRALTITRVIVAHRPETIKQADRVLVINDGKLTLEKG